MQKKKCSCIDKYIALKDIVTLLANAKEPYDAMDAQYIQSMIIPPIELNQFHIFYKDKRPVGFTTWSFLNKEAEKKLTNSEEYLTKDDWNSGDTCWHIDTVCNDISVLKVHRWTNNNLKKIIGAGKKVYWVRVNKDGSLRKLGWAKTR
jgi:hemolysin-activating ACP:hemolysin acyltransferase